MNILGTVFKKVLPENSEKRILGWIGHLFFLLMIFGCMIYAPERMLECDASYYTFHVVNAEEVFILHGRYINYLTQTPALLAIDMGANLLTVLTVYSMTAFVWFYLIFIFIFHALRNPTASLLLIFSLCLTMRYKHYAGHTEITFAIAVACLLFAWMATDKSGLSWFKSWMHWPGLVIICAWLFVIHPVIIVPICMILGADILINNRWKDWSNWVSLAIVILTFGIKFLTEVFNNSYETGKVSMLGNFMEIVQKPSKFPVVFNIVGEYFTQQYFLVFPVFLASLIILCFRKKWLTALYLFVSAAILLGLVILVHSDLRSRLLFIFDGYIGMLGMVFGLTIIYAFTPYLNKLWTYLLLFLLIALSVFQIEAKHKFFENRLKAMDKTFEMNDNHEKLFVELKDYNWEKMWYPYEVAMESLIWTSLKGKEHSKTIYVDSKSYRTKVNVDSIEGFFVFGRTGTLSDKFFNLPDVKYKLTDKVGWKD